MVIFNIKGIDNIADSSKKHAKEKLLLVALSSEALGS
jgi:hypothetical protein